MYEGAEVLGVGVDAIRERASSTSGWQLQGDYPREFERLIDELREQKDDS